MPRSLARLLAIAVVSALVCVGARAQDNAAAPVTVEGFTFLGWKTFECDNDVEGKKSFRIAVYRCDLFAKAVGVELKGEIGSAVDTEFVLLPPDGKRTTAKVGSPGTEAGRATSEDQRDVEIRPFLIARTETSQRIYDKLGGPHRDFMFPGPLNPVENASWDDAQEWFKANPGPRLSLPSEGAWEYACRGGTTTPFYFGSTIQQERVTYNGIFPYRPGDPKGKFRGPTTPVASLPANAFGLFDTHGNVWEWCKEVHPSGSGLVSRGGSASSGASYCRSASRNGADSALRTGIIGFRASRSLP